MIHACSKRPLMKCTAGLAGGTYLCLRTKLNLRIGRFSIDGMLLERVTQITDLGFLIFHGYSGIRPSALMGIHETTTRGSVRKITIPRARRNVRHHLFLNRTCQEFHRILSLGRSSNKLTSFKATLEKYPDVTFTLFDGLKNCLLHFLCAASFCCLCCY
ncbi:hypothetical protein COOONC_00439 [Cooperia oncophora]